MSKTSILKTLRIALGLEKFMVEAVTNDGVNIKAESLEVGQTLLIVAEDGTEMPATEGDYVTAENTIKVDANGLITEVVPVEVPMEDPEEPAVEVEIEQASVVKEETEFEKQVMEILSALTDKVKMLEDELAKTKCSAEEVKTEMAAIKSTPIGKKVKTAPIDSKENTNPTFQKLLKLREELNKK